MKEFSDILNIARENINHNPSLQGKDGMAVFHRYLRGLQDEVAEVSEEAKPNNQVHLADELSDIAWDYACVLAQAEKAGLIESADSVLKHGLEKYRERAPAFLHEDEVMWESIKAKQKVDLKHKHEEKYGN